MGSVFRNARTLVAALATAVVLLAPSAALVASTTDRQLGPGEFVLAMLIADMMLCVFLGLACMLLGFAIAAIKCDWSSPQPLLGFGAALMLIFLPEFGLARLFWRPTSPSSPGPGPARGS